MEEDEEASLKREGSSTFIASEGGVRLRPYSVKLGGSISSPPAVAAAGPVPALLP